MSRSVSTLDPIIRRVEKKLQSTDGTQTLIFDEKNREILLKEPSALHFGKKISYYQVSTGNMAKGQTFPVPLGNMLVIELSFSASCPFGNEEKMVIALFDKERLPESVLQDKLRLYVRNVFETAPKFNNGALLLNYLAEKVSERCLGETGILITADLRFQNDHNLKRFTIKGGPLTVRVKDYDENLSLDYELEVAPAEGKWEQALKKMSDIEVLKEKLKEIIINTIAHSANLDQFCFSLNVAGEHLAIKDLLTPVIKEQLNIEGRTIGHLHLSSSSIENIKPPATVEIYHPDSYKLADEDLKINVKSDVSLFLTSISAYKRAEQKFQIKKGFKEWFTESVIISLVKKVMFETHYRDLVEEPQTIKKKIKDEISATTQQLGYNIIQHNHIPEIDKYDLEKEFTIDSKEEFETNNTNVKIKLSIIITGNIGRLKNLHERLLHPRVIIPNEMKTDVLSIIKTQIHQLDPEQIYMHFDASTEYKPVKELLSEKITEKFRNKYDTGNTLNVSVNFDQKEDMVHKKATEMQKQVIQIVVTAFPGTMEGIDYEISFRIIRVNKSGWYLFQTKIDRSVEEEINELKNALKSSIAKKLKSLSYERVMSDNYETQLWIDDHIIKTSLVEIGVKFGLDLSLVTSLRNLTITEGQWLEKNKNEFQQTLDTIAAERVRFLTSMQDKLKFLYTQKEEAVTMKNKEKLQDIENQINETQALITPNTSSGSGMFSRLQGIKNEQTDNYRLPPSDNNDQQFLSDKNNPDSNTNESNT